MQQKAVVNMNSNCRRDQLIIPQLDYDRSFYTYVSNVTHQRKNTLQFFYYWQNLQPKLSSQSYVQ